MSFNTTHEKSEIYRLILRESELITASAIFLDVSKPRFASTVVVSKIYPELDALYISM